MVAGVAVSVVVYVDFEADDDDAVVVVAVFWIAGTGEKAPEQYS